MSVVDNREREQEKKNKQKTVTHERRRPFFVLLVVFVSLVINGQNKVWNFFERRKWKKENQLEFGMFYGDCI